MRYDVPLHIWISSAFVFFSAIMTAVLSIGLSSGIPGALVGLAMGALMFTAGYGLLRKKLRRLTMWLMAFQAICVLIYLMVFIDSHPNGSVSVYEGAYIFITLVLSIVVFANLAANDFTERPADDATEDEGTANDDASSGVPDAPTADEDAITFNLWDGVYRGAATVTDDGQYIPEGRGEYSTEYVSFVGTWSDGLPNGRGTETTSEYVATGTWSNGKREGEFVIRTASYVERGQYRDGTKNGRWVRDDGIVETWSNGQIIRSESLEAPSQDDSVPETDADVSGQAEVGSRSCPECKHDLSGIGENALRCPYCGARI